jgi:SAM-dependent methyltransferase
MNSREWGVLMSATTTLEGKMTESKDQIHEAVREHYAERIKADSSCCGSNANCCSSGQLYPADLLNTLPAGEAPISYGCGDPVTLASLLPGQTVLDLGSGAGLDCFFAAGKVAPDGRVIGVDMTPEMIDRPPQRHNASS